MASSLGAKALLTKVSTGPRGGRALLLAFRPLRAPTLTLRGRHTLPDRA